MTTQPTAPPTDEAADDPRWTPEELATMEDDEAADPPAEPEAPPAKAAEPLPEWKLDSAVVMMGSRSEVTLTISRGNAGLLADSAWTRDRELKAQVVEAVRATPEYAAHKASAEKVAGLDSERRRLEEVVKDIDAQLDQGPGADAVSEFADTASAAAARLNVIKRAMRAAVGQRDDTARAVHVVATKEADRVQQEATEKTSGVKKDLEAALCAAAAALDALVTAESVIGIIGSWHWSKLTADAAAGCPCPPPKPPAPPAGYVGGVAGLPLLLGPTATDWTELARVGLNGGRP